jgi:hypothetical protein
MPDADYDDPDHELWSLGRYGSKAWVLSHFGCPTENLTRTRRALIDHLRHRCLYDVASILDLVGDVAVTQSIWSKLAESCHRFVDYPFNDGQLLESAYRVDWGKKLGPPKRLIREALRLLHVPDHILNRPKLGFGVHRRGWARPDGVLQPLVCLATKFFGPAEIKALQTGDPVDASTFWTLLNYAIWKRLCIDGESLDSLSVELDRQLSP